MKYLTLLLLLSTPLMAQDRTGRICPSDPYALGRPTVEELQQYEGSKKTKVMPAAEYEACKSVKLASEGDAELNRQFADTFIALTVRIQALEEHVASETRRIDSTLQNINTRLVELNARPAYVKPAQQYTPPTITVPDYGTAPATEPVRKSNRWDNAENNLK